MAMSETRKHTEESKKRMSEARRAWWARQTPERVAETKKRIKENHARPSLGKTGPAAPGWRGGRYTTKRDGYIFVYAPDHPQAKRSGKGSGGYVLEHRLVMEKIVGRLLHTDEDVNHINGIKHDNRPENLRLVSHYAHFEEHGCPNCGFHFFTK